MKLKKTRTNVHHDQISGASSKISIPCLSSINRRFQNQQPSLPTSMLVGETRAVRSPSLDSN